LSLVRLLALVPALPRRAGIARSGPAQRPAFAHGWARPRLLDKARYAVTSLRRKTVIAAMIATTT
jgi:hypothetical protein